jgi:hypothetical protein
MTNAVRVQCLATTLLGLACSSRQAGDDGSTLVEVRAEAVGSSCHDGGAVIVQGVDRNHDGRLSGDEITSRQVVCHHADPTALAIVELAPEPAGANCPAGGTRVRWGVDLNKNNQLDAAELEGSLFVCNGRDGTPGAAGADGFTTLFTSEPEPVSGACPFGGVRLSHGLDRNRNGVLDPAEVERADFVCNGAPGRDGQDGHDGADGRTSLLRRRPEPPGPHCPSGGTAIDVGVDLDGDGQLTDGEVTGTGYACNATQPLFASQPLAPGDRCPAGGFTLSWGADTNGDGTLQPTEVQGSRDVCNGVSTADAGAGTPEADTGSDAGASTDAAAITLPATRTVTFSPAIGRVAIMLSVDGTGDMGATVQHLPADFLNLVGFLSAFPGVQAVYGAGTYRDFPGCGFGDVGDQPWTWLNLPTFAANDTRTSLLGISAAGGGDEPESGYEALYQIATGAGASFTGCATGSISPAGGTIFPPDHLPVVLQITSAPSHTDYGPGLIGAHGRDAALQALRSRGVRVLSIQPPESGGLSPQASDQLDELATSTGAAVPACAVEPLCIPPGTCCVGGLPRNPLPSGLCPLHAATSPFGGGANAMMGTVAALLRYGAFDVAVRIRSSGDPAAPDLSCLVRHVRATTFSGEMGCLAAPVAEEDRFLGVVPGAGGALSFELDLDNQDCVTPGSSPQAFTLNLDLVDVTSGALFGQTSVDVTIPPAPRKPRLLGASAQAAGAVVLTFDQPLAPTAVAADGSQFVIGGLMVLGASANGSQVTLATTPQIPSASYTVTVAADLADPGAATAVFTGFEVPMRLVLNEVNPALPQGADIVELLATQSGGVGGFTVEEGVLNPVLLATLPSLHLNAGDLMVVHLTPPPEVITETTSPAECLSAACFVTAWDVAGAPSGLGVSDRVLVVRRPDRTIVNAVPFSGGSPSSASLADKAAIEQMGLWSGSPANWQDVSSRLSVQRRGDTDSSADWSIAVTTYGGPNQ